MILLVVLAVIIRVYGSSKNQHKNNVLVCLWCKTMAFFIE